VVAVVTLESIRADASPKHIYPRRVLRRRDTALVMFAAAFYGRQDAYWVAHAGMTGTCVDLDHTKLGEMALAYPEGWEYVHGDAFDYARRTTRQWDVVSVDWPTPYFSRIDEFLPLWCKLARRAVVVGTGADSSFVVPEGWTVTEEIRRSEFLPGGVFWTVLERC
jgi:hypothetical protein